MWLNPIVKKDVKVQARSFKMCVEVFVYEIIMALVFFCCDAFYHESEPLFEQQYIQSDGMAVSGAFCHTVVHIRSGDPDSYVFCNLRGEGTADV